MKKNSEFKTFEDGKCLHIDSSRLDECLKYMYDNNIKHIKIGCLFYKEKDISFLNDLKDYL
ncbi:MAG: hypothetical protein IJU47_04835, partial [Verrucomicrobia bacterium]|nr:hypothetical protein [Verrucomicrobiota bacterium]